MKCCVPACDQVLTISFTNEVDSHLMYFINSSKAIMCFVIMSNMYLSSTADKDVITYFISSAAVLKRTYSSVGNTKATIISTVKSAERRF